MVGGGTLWIKLKISEEDLFEEHKKQDDDVMGVGDKDEDEDIEVEIPKNNDDDDDNRRRICHVCNKGFSSGKALGGHMRIHVQAAKKHLLSGKKAKKPTPPPLFDRYYKQRDNDDDDEEEDEDEDQLLPVCSVCGKNFPSMKSLFGHMRCHPERAWRGIQPPDEIDRRKISSAKTTVRVPGWSVTAKRGGRKRNAEEEEEDDQEQLQDAVHHLMLLANGDSVESGLTGRDENNNHDDIPEEELLEKTNSNSLTSKAENEGLAVYHVSDPEIIDNKKRRRKKMKLKHLDSVRDSASPVSKFKCNTCGRIFATHQALGGHKSSHNKFRMVIQNSDVTYNNVGAVTSEEEEEAAGSSSKLLADGKLATQLINSPAEFNSTGPRFLDFDLNEFPPDDHEDELSGNHDYFPFFSPI